MIGNQFWSTGIALKWDGYKWSIWLDFYDDGWAQISSTEGKLKCRYAVETIEIAVSLDTLISDAKKLGIHFATTQLYIPGDGEWASEVYHPGWRRIISEQCARLGWKDVYTAAQEQDAGTNTGK